MNTINKLLALCAILSDNQGFDNPEVSEDEDFHQHLDRCRQCADHPFALCATGLLLLKRDAARLDESTIGHPGGQSQ